MNPCFADTFYFIALLNPEDESHQRVLPFAQNMRRPIFTSTWILLELGNYLGATPSRNLYHGVVQSLRNQPFVTIIPATEELFNRGVELYDARLDKFWSLTDCISFVVMRERQITDALTGDHHFEQAGFTALLK